MGKSNQENRTWLAGSMAADFYSDAFNSRDVGENLGEIQIDWTGFDALDGLFKIQVSGTGQAWNDAGGSEVECIVDTAADTQVFAVNLSAFPFFRLVFLKGSGSAGTFVASYFFRGTN